jgi:Mg2+/Co2+ transporter CorB
MEIAFIVYLASITFLVLVAAFFSAAETSLTAASSVRIHQLKTSGNKRAHLITRLRDDKDGLIGAILLGNTAVNIIASALATALTIQFFGEKWVIYETIVMTFVVLIFGEVLPKTYAFYNAERMSLLLAPFLYRFVQLVTPITVLVRNVVSGILFLCRISKENQDMVSPAEELRGAIDFHHAKGEVVKQDRDMLASILDLERVEIKDIMIHRKYITSINIDEPVSKIVDQVLDNRFTRIPLWKDKPENVVAVLHAKALLTALRNHHSGDLEDLNISKIASAPWFVPETNSLGGQLLQFRKKRTHLALVVDEYGDLVGLVTLEDILEEIVGDIEDEHDTDIVGIRPLGKQGAYVVNGDVSVRDINRELGWKLSDKHAATVAGLLIHELEYIPEEGEEGKIASISFKVLKKENNRISKVRLKKIVKSKVPGKTKPEKPSAPTVNPVNPS